MANCVHGFPAGQCLICSTLGNGGGTTTAQATAASGRRRRGTKSASAPTGDLALAYPAGAVPQARAGGGPPSRRSGHSVFFAVVAALVIGGLFVWAFAGIVSLAFHIAEYVALAVAAGWVGYKAGYARGRRHPR